MNSPNSIYEKMLSIVEGLRWELTNAEERLADVSTLREQIEALKLKSEAQQDELESLRATVQRLDRKVYTLDDRR